MRVLKKQSNSKMCLICGINNPAGLKAPFYEMENHTVISVFKYQNIHQSYPERTHGGMISSMLDEIIGRAIWIDEPDAWGATMELKVKFRKPVPYDTSLIATGKITKNNSRAFVGVGTIRNIKGDILAEAEATYFKCPLSKLVVSDVHKDVNVYIEDNIKEIDINFCI